MTTIRKSLTTSDGVVRTVEFSVVKNEVRVHRVEGDITDREALAELAQILAIENHCEKAIVRV